MQFHKMLDELCTVSREELKVIVDDNGNQSEEIIRKDELDEEKYDKTLGLFERSFKENLPPFAGDLENETYKSILAKFRSY